MRYAMALGLMACWALAGCARTPAPEGPVLTTVPAVDLNRYLGTWYEIASYPAWFQKGCAGTSATYTTRPDGDIDVLNRCHKDTLDGALREAHGHARVTDPKTNAKLEVTFFWPFWGDYWVIDLGPNYDYAVVGQPDRKYLWILSRTPQMDPALYATILTRLTRQGYDIAKLQKTAQPLAAPSAR